MARPPLVLETWGKVRRTIVAGKPAAVAYYRDSDGITRKMQRQGDTPAQAERNLIKALRDRVAPTGETITRESSLTELATAWLDEIEKQGKAAATLSRYRSTVHAQINEHVGAVRIREATPPRLQRIVDRVAESSGPAQARMLGVVLNGMCSLAVRYGAAPSNAADELRVPKRAKAPVRAPGVEDVRALRAAMKAWDARPPHRDGSQRDMADLVDVLLGTGCRPGEALALRWDDIDLAGGWVTITSTVTRIEGEGLKRQENPKSEASNRRLALPKFVLDALTARRVKAYCEWVFPSAVGTLRWPETVRTHWNAALRETDVKWMTPKDCRKAVATLLGVEDAQLQLGHEPGSAVTGRHYVEKPLERPDMAAKLEVFAR
jgi:integrase